MRCFIVLLFCMFFGHAQEALLSSVNTLIFKKEYKTAQTLLEKQLQSNSSLRLKDKLGEVYSYQENWDAAIEVYKDLTTLDSKNADYQYKYGGVLGKKALASSKFTALMIVGDMKKAFVNAAELDPTHIDVRWALVDVFISLPGILGGSKAKAYMYAKELSAISPIDGCFALGYVSEYDNQPKQAKEHYLKAFKLVDTYGEIKRSQLHYQIGKVSCDYGMKLDRGIFHMEQYIKKFSVKDGVPLEWAYYRMAKMYRQKKEKKQATFWIQKALVKQSNFKLAIKERALISAL